MPKALVDRIIVGPDGQEYRLCQGQTAPELPDSLAAALESQCYIEVPRPDQQATVPARAGRKKGV